MDIRLAEAAKKGSVSDVIDLINKGAKDIGWAMDEAAHYGRFEVVKLLTEKGAGCYHAAAIAAYEGYLDIVKFFDTQCELDYLTLLKEACRGGKLNVFIFVFNKRKYRYYEFNDVIRNAVIYDYKDILEFLADNGVLDQEYAVGQAKTYNPKIIDYLLSLPSRLEYLTTVPTITKKQAQDYLYRDMRTFNDIWSDLDTPLEHKVGIYWRDHLRQPLHQREADEIISRIEAVTGNDIIPVGEYRRKKFPLHMLTLVAPISGNLRYIDEFVDKITTLSLNILPDNENKIVVYDFFQLQILISHKGIARYINIKFCEPDQTPVTVFYYTGDENFVSSFKLRLSLKKYYLNPMTITKNSNNLPVEIANEDDIFELLEIPYVAPENRDKSYKFP